MTIEAMKQALAALEDAQRHHYALKHKETDELVTALRAAIEQAQPKRQPVQESALTHNHLWIGELYGRGKNT